VGASTARWWPPRWAKTNARQAEYSQAERTIAAAVAQSYFRLQLLWARQDNALAMAALQRDVIDDKAARIAHGLANIDEQRNAERDLGTLRERPPPSATQAERETKRCARCLAAANWRSRAGRSTPAWPACRASWASNCWHAGPTCRLRAGASKRCSDGSPPARPPTTRTSI